jgi:hypothetical protein
MPSARHEVTIDRPAADVFAFIADGMNGQWRPGVLDTGIRARCQCYHKQGVGAPADASSMPTIR